MKNSKLFITILIVLVAAVVSYNATKKQTQVLDELRLKVTDGPYVFAKNNQLDAYWLCSGEITHQQLSIVQFPLDIEYCDLKATVLGKDAREDNVVTYSGNFNIAALSDFHGQYDLMKTLLTNNNIIDQFGDWSFGDGHFVITGDVFDRGDKVTEILWFLYRLEQQALKSGGQVHLLLGNHEVMVLNGDLRYLHPKYVETARLLEKPFEQLFSNESVLGNWLRAKPVLVKINNMLFAHGGFHPSLAREKRTLHEINQVFKANLVETEMDESRSGWGEFLHKSNGPIWYRGYFKDDGATAEEIALLLTHFDIEYLVVGHTSQEQIETRFEGKVIAIDSSIKNGLYGEILLIDGEGIQRGSLKGERFPLN